MMDIGPGRDPEPLAANEGVVISVVFRDREDERVWAVAAGRGDVLLGESPGTGQTTVLQVITADLHRPLLLTAGSTDTLAPHTGASRPVPTSMRAPQ